MTIEEIVFLRKRFDADKMLAFGFVRSGDCFRYTRDFMNGDFRAELSVAEDGAVRGCVIDSMNDEVYAPLRSPDFEGPYVNTVRAEYEALLISVAEHCCVDMPFASEQANRITEQIYDRYGVRPDFPWGESPYDGAGVFRHKASGKWFALIMRIRRLNLLKNGDETSLDAMNLKIAPETQPDLLKREGIFPAFHMNHKHWITVVLDETLSDDYVMKLVSDSFYLTQTKKDRI